MPQFSVQIDFSTQQVRMGKPKKRSNYVKKRVFCGNQHVNKKKMKHLDNIQLAEASCNYAVQSPCQVGLSDNVGDFSRSFEESEGYISSISFSKLEGFDENHTTSTPIRSGNEKVIHGYRLVDMTLLGSILNRLCCPKCFKQTLALEEDTKNKKGFSSCLEVVCECGFKITTHTSERCGKGFEVNRRMVYAMRACGQGFTGVERFATFLNMPKPMTANNYEKISNKSKEAVKNIAEKTMYDAATEIKFKLAANDDTIVDTAISCDGTWQRRGYSSLNGIVTIISMENGKILDVEPMTRICKACKLKENIKSSSPDEYAIWKAQHVYSADYHGSAPNMEPVGAKRMFDRSIQKYKLRYTEFYGDGDSKSFPTIQNIYDDVTVKKLECIGHVQKRVGTRLRKLKQNVKGIGGKGKLTNAVIDRLQNYYGLAIRQNGGFMEEMKKAIHASLFHVASSDKNEWHTDCPDGPSSWCHFKRDVANGTQNYHPGKGLPLDIVAKSKPIYNDLSTSELLEKCLHGKTQNQNEAFTGMVWDRIPKSTYVARNQLELGTYDAVATFNIGRKATFLTFQYLDINPGKYTTAGCKTMNSKRLFHAGYKNSRASKERHKAIRGQKQKREDTAMDKEGRSYSPGGF